MHETSVLSESRERGGPGGECTARWTHEAIARLGELKFHATPLIGAAQADPVDPALDVWDAWPLADSNGQPVVWRDGELWFALAVDRNHDPESRHLRARIHHFHRKGDRFRHLGLTLPEGLNPAVCQWSGSALYDDGQATLYFTATGNRTDPECCFQQRLFACKTTLGKDQDFGNWHEPREIVKADGIHYRPANQRGGEPGKIKAFRDPCHFRNDDGQDYLLFTGSSAIYPGAYDGVIGIARADDAHGFLPLAPLITATGINNELERPHIVRHDGRLYLFWSTQRGVFAPGIDAPSGLFGATAACLKGPWEFLNGHGLVLCNPPDNPTQAYSWWVLPDLTVTSFVDYWAPHDPNRSEVETRRERFGGTFAPFVSIELDGISARLVPRA